MAARLHLGPIDMPSYPRSRSYATPEEAFGITQRPLNDWFDAAASGMTRSGPAFSQSFEDATLRNQQRELEAEKLRRQLESEQAASAFLQRAAGEKPDALMQMIAEDPAILGSADYGNIRDYIATRQQVQQQKQAQQPYSNKVLGPAIMKSLPPADQARLQRRINETGENIVDAYEAFEQEKKTAAQRTELNTKRIGLLAKGFDANLVNEAASSENPLEAFAIIEGSKKTGGDEDMSVKELVDLREALNNSGEPPDPAVLSWINEQIKFKTVGMPPALITNKPTASPLTGTASASQATQPPAPVEVEDALSPFEEKLASQVAQPSQAAQELNQSWTEAKSKPLSEAPAAEGLNPDRLFGLAKSAIVGGPVEGTQQEQQLAKLVATYAKRAASGGKVLVGTESRMIGPGESVPENVYETPGKALLKKLGSDPEKEVTIPRGGVFGDKKMKAWQLMDLYLKEVGQPLNDAKAAAKAAAENTPTVPVEEMDKTIDKYGG